MYMRNILITCNKVPMSIYESNKNRSINHKLKRMILKCNNPLYKDTKDCIILWEELDKFNQKVDLLEYSILNINFDYDSYNLKNSICDDPDNAYLSECKMYD